MHYFPSQFRNESEKIEYISFIFNQILTLSIVHQFKTSVKLQITLLFAEIGFVHESVFSLKTKLFFIYDLAEQKTGFN